jgi:GNAT superfamily N-acetyltransferase
MPAATPAMPQAGLRGCAARVTTGAMPNDVMSEPSPITLRAPAPGDYGWIVRQHGLVYGCEYGWDISFEGLVAGLVADFSATHEPARERCWIAVLDGGPVGSIFCTRKDDETRMLIVSEAARGHGVGALLVDTCMGFARAAGYSRMTLWTNDILTAARKLYAARGWRMTAAEPVRQFGQAMVSETWEVGL